MGSLSWYWYRWRAMSPGEMALHVRKKFRQFVDARRRWDFTDLKLEGSGAFPKLPKAEDAPAVLREALQRDAERILAGRWKAFGHLELKVDDPPKWRCDYLVGEDLATNESGFKLNSRELPRGADIKLIWELSRWHPLVRLAMAAYVLGDRRAGEKCVEWLEDWVKHNPPYRGWNWTSALEVGMRLIAFTWIDALLTPSLEERLGRLRGEILPPHVWYAWRHQSFGSSANNHLLGELAGCILATVRWPALAKWGAPIEELQARWEREVLAQFAEDGGNREQALNYHLFSWELCWQTFQALEAAGQKISGHVEQRLSLAAKFFWETQARSDPWDYGDSDNAIAVPFFANDSRVVQEWQRWLAYLGDQGAIRYWVGLPPWTGLPLTARMPANTIQVGEWWYYPNSGLGICESGFWWLRWDLSPLGHLATAAHGHWDALHLSIWWKGVALVIDPGTGAYYSDQALRTWLASRAAHNGPCPVGDEFPKRVGPFLWSEHHLAPAVRQDAQRSVGWLNLIGCQLRRTIELQKDGQAWCVQDGCFGKDGTPRAFSVRWQFAPETYVRRIHERRFLVGRQGAKVEIELSEGWAEVELVELDELELKESAKDPATGSDGRRVSSPREHRLAGIVSPAFRKTVWAPYLKLFARPHGDKPCVFQTTFLACGD
jgi:hypothetical protein